MPLIQSDSGFPLKTRSRREGICLGGIYEKIDKMVLEHGFKMVGSDIFGYFLLDKIFFQMRSSICSFR